MVTQKQIAQRVGLSQSAVACAFHPVLHVHLSPHKRQKILATAARLGYEPHQGARRLSRRRFRQTAREFDQAGLIYFAGADINLNPVCLQMIFGAEHELSKFRASFVFVNAGLEGGWEKVERLSGASGVDGWMVYGAVDDDIVSRLKRCELPFVILGDHRSTQSVHCVGVDNAATGRLAAQYLAAQGHHRIAYLAGNPRYSYQPEMEKGFRDARKEFGLDDDERLILNLAAWAGGQPIVDWLSRPGPVPKPTALFASEFDLAGDLHRILREAQLAVPADISVLGYEPSALRPTKKDFTRIELPTVEVGRQGAALLQQITLDPETAPREIRIAPSLEEGGSVVPPINRPVHGA